MRIVEPDDLVVYKPEEGDEWVIETEAGVELRRYPTQREAWGFAEVRARSNGVSAWRHEEDGSISGHVSYRSSIPFPGSRRVWAGVGAGLAVVATLIGIGVATSDRAADSVSSPEEGTETVAQGLAVLDEGGFVPVDDPSVIDYQMNLDRLRDETCFISEERVADMAVASRRSAGLTSASLLEVLEEANRAAALAPDPEAVAISLGLPQPASAEDECAVYFTAAVLKLGE